MKIPLRLSSDEIFCFRMFVDLNLDIFLTKYFEFCIISLRFTQRQVFFFCRKRGFDFNVGRRDLNYSITGMHSTLSKFECIVIAI